MKARTRDGAEIFYQLHDFTDPWKPAEAVILHHGGRGNHQQWYRWIPLLARKYRTIAIDARGRGQSTIPSEGHTWSMDQFAADVVAVLDDAGVEKVHYIGNSFGSVVGERVAATYPERVQTLTLLSPIYRMNAMRDDTTRWVEEIERLGSLEFHRREVRKMLPEGTDPGLLEWQARQMADVPVPVVRSFMKFTQTIDQTDLLPRIAAPTLLLVPTRSDRTPTAESEFMAQRIPNVRMVTFDAPHNLMLGAAERCVELILPFLEQHRGIGG